MFIRLSFLALLLAAMPLTATAATDTPETTHDKPEAQALDAPATPAWQSEQFWTEGRASSMPVSVTPLLDAQRSEFAGEPLPAYAPSNAPVQRESGETEGRQNRRLLYIVAGTALAAGVATGAILLLGGDSADEAGLPDPPGRPPGQ